MDNTEEFAHRANALHAKFALHFGRQAEMLEAANARMANCVEKLRAMHATQAVIRSTLDRIEEKF